MVHQLGPGSSRARPQSCRLAHMNIDIFSDIVCPWCFIGKRQIDAALDAFARASGGDAPRVVWRPFQLNPQLPPEGMSRKDYVSQKFGGKRSDEVYARVAAVGKQHGIDFAFDRIVRQPNTLAAHCLIGLAATADPSNPALQSAVKEALMRAYFLDGVDLTQSENLIAIAAGAGLDRDDAERCLADPGVRQQIAQQEGRARAMGVQGVPFFIFDGRLAVSGAQGTPALVEAMRQAQALAA